VSEFASVCYKVFKIITAWDSLSPAHANQSPEKLTNWKQPSTRFTQLTKRRAWTRSAKAHSTEHITWVMTRPHLLQPCTRHLYGFGTVAVDRRVWCTYDFLDCISPSKALWRPACVCEVYRAQKRGCWGCLYYAPSPRFAWFSNSTSFTLEDHNAVTSRRASNAEIRGQKRAILSE